MNLYHISQDANQNYGTYDSAVVAAVSSKRARDMHPQSGHSLSLYAGHDWCPASLVKVRYLGKAARGTKAGVICASFNAG